MGNLVKNEFKAAIGKKADDICILITPQRKTIQVLYSINFFKN